MKERGIIFSGPMIIPILDGRKTMTRRLDKRWLTIKWEDRLWVRETWIPTMDGNRVADYRATAMGREYATPWKPSIYMPKWASRITLEATADAKMDRLQNMEEIDFTKEGTIRTLRGYDALCYLRSNFQKLWDSLNPKVPWESNPEVVILEFKRIKT